VKRVVVTLVALAVLVASSSCGEGANAPKTEVRAALARTKRLARSFEYTERSATTDVVVRGIVDDDYRYKAQLAVRGRLAVEQIAVDDALAARILDREQIAQLVSTGVPQGRELEALLARRWVVDPYGAPEIAVTRAGAERKVGDDAILDGLTALGYVSGAIDEAPFVRRFNKESIEYRAQDDPFPAPKEGSGVLRYDTVQPPLPRPSRSGAGAAQNAPQTSHFRRLAIYVKDGLVIDVREVIAPVQRQLEHLAEFYDIETTGNLAQAGEQAIGKLNELRTGAGEQRIRTRAMTFELFDLGRRRTIALPSGAIEGNLDILSGRGRSTQTGGT
jgi:hypothetical protein